MNTIIPNELSFDLDLNDLPARASSVDEKDTMNLSGGRKTTWRCFSPDPLGRNAGLTAGTVTIWWGHTIGDASWACRKWRCANCQSSGEV